MNHFSKDGIAKLLPRCTLPFTGLEVVDLVITEMGVFKPNGSKFEILQLATGIKAIDLKIDMAILC
jgi:3-oxoacid CoA-transferase subunit B